MKNVTVPIFKNPSMVWLRKTLPVSIPRSTFGDDREPENLLWGILSSLSQNTLCHSLSLSAPCPVVDLLLANIWFYLSFLNSFSFVFMIEWKLIECLKSCRRYLCMRRQLRTNIDFSGLYYVWAFLLDRVSGPNTSTNRPAQETKLGPKGCICTILEETMVL